MAYIKPASTPEKLAQVDRNILPNYRKATASFNVAFFSSLAFST